MITLPMPRLTRLWRWLPSMVLLALVAMFADALPWPLLVVSLRGASLPLVAIAVLSTGLAVVARTLLFWRLLRGIGVDSPWLAARATVTAIALNGILIGQAGEAGRVLLVVRGSRLTSGPVLASVVFEHAMISAIYLLLILTAGAVLPMPEALARWRVPALITVVALGCLVLLIGNLREAGSAGTAGKEPGMLQRIRRISAAFFSALRQLASARQLSGGLTLSASHWVLQLAAFYATTAALGFTIEPAATMVAFMAVTASSSVRLTPGNIGVSQAVFAGVAGTYGVPAQESIAIALLWQAIQTVPVAIGALVLAPSSWAMLREKSLDRESSSTSVVAAA